jgi:hypothetical protein
MTIRFACFDKKHFVNFFVTRKFIYNLHFSQENELNNEYGEVYQYYDNYDDGAGGVG